MISSNIIWSRKRKALAAGYFAADHGSRDRISSASLDQRTTTPASLRSSPPLQAALSGRSSVAAGPARSRAFAPDLSFLSQTLFILSLPLNELFRRWRRRATGTVPTVPMVLPSGRSDQNHPDLQPPSGDHSDRGSSDAWVSAPDRQHGSEPSDGRSPDPNGGLDDPLASPQRRRYLASLPDSFRAA